MIAIVDYGMGNLRSVQKAFEKLGCPAEITNHAQRIQQAEKIVVPGVGAFRDAMDELRRRDLIAPIVEAIDQGKPFLGICLGLQLLMTVSEEDGEHAGLDIIPGRVVRFRPPAGLKVPHMGWNQLHARRPVPLLAGAPDVANVYFVHSYYVAPDDPDVIAAETDYPTPFTSMIWRDNVYACQFHPEKSQSFGLRILQNFIEL
jgi:imidazole glycerol-phosphate synthase subunit HisH